MQAAEPEPSVLKPGIASRPPRMTQAQSNILASIANVVGSAGAAFEVLRQARVLHLTITDIEQELARRRLPGAHASTPRSEEHTSELPSLMRISYAVFCLKKKNSTN